MRQWTPKERQRQSELVHKWKPWEHSTGPRDTTKTRLNAMKHGLRSTGIFGNYDSLLLKEYGILLKGFRKALEDAFYIHNLMNKKDLDDEADLKKIEELCKEYGSLGES